MSFLWIFGDGGTSTKENPIYIYDSQGNYTLTFKAMCGGDTSVVTENIYVKAAPEDLIIKQVSVWLPASYTNANVFCVVSLVDGNHIWEKYESGTTTATSFPLSWYFNEELFFFDEFNDDNLFFDIVDDVTGEYIYTYSLTLSNLKTEHYPETWYVNSGDDFEMEIIFEYQ